MSIVNKYNNRVFDYSIPEGHEYTKPEELYKKNGANHEYVVRAIYINDKSRFGESPILVTTEELINAPSFMLDTVKKMLNDEDIISLANEGRLGITIYEYNHQTYGKRYGINWIELAF